MERLLAACLLAATFLPARAELTIQGTRFLLDVKPFPYAGLSFFNAIYNAEFNGSTETRRHWLGRFQTYGINVLRIWAQWDSRRGYADTCPTCTLYQEDGSLRTDRVATLKQILSDTESRGIVVELVLFAQESWHNDIRLSDAAAERAVAALAKELLPYRNLTLQI